MHPLGTIGEAARRLRAGLTTMRALRIALLVAILAGLAAYKLRMTAHTTSVGVDGGYYATVAAFVRDGQGLSTNISLFHAGFPRLPHPTSVYPLWPLLWGYTARVFPLVPAGLWLATACYFLSLVLAYAWATSLLPGVVFPSARLGLLDAGHVLVLMLGSSSQYYRFTSWPYTEGLGFVLTFAALWRFNRIAPAPSLLGGVEMGLWLGLCTLCRTQLVLLALAFFPAVAAAALAIRDRRARYATMAMAAAIAFAATLLPHYWYIRGFLPEATVGTMFRFDKLRVTEHLSTFVVIKPSAGLRDFLVDRAAGFRVAFDADSKYAYAFQFYLYQWAPVIALPMALASAARWTWRRGARDAWRWLRRQAGSPLLFPVLLGTGAFLSIHTMHKADGGWYFQSRQALPCIITFFLAMAWLLSRRGVVGKTIALSLLIASTVEAVPEVQALTRARLKESQTVPRAELVSWLRKRRERGELTVALREAQPIAYLTLDVGYHWYHSGTTIQDLEQMVTRLGVDYVLVPRRGWPFMRSPRFKERFQKVGTRSGLDIYAPSGVIALPPEADRDAEPQRGEDPDEEE